MTMNNRPTPSPRRTNALPNGASWPRRATAASADLEFGRFRVLLRRRQLLAGGVPVELGTRAFDLLLALLEADGSLVTKDELMSWVWPGIVVSEDNLKFQVSVLRKALGADRDLIRTEFGRGYRFTGVVRTDAARDPCRRSTRAKLPSSPAIPGSSPGRGGLGRGLPSCRHSLQCSVNRSRALTGDGFAVSTQ
ncbi:MAG TPA: winged helix-turn-helix domain-containing protein [Stellaceae bacterium]|nr:winged helix-turn-helix domain-containing protein [Stellaceae bacterium]